MSVAEARIGPNAITQTFAAIRDLAGADALSGIAEAAGCAPWLSAPPEAMVGEGAVVRLFRAMEGALATEADFIAAEAGRRTGDYILAHRIPRPAQTLLRVLPPRLAAWVLLRAIERHAWTFAGSGRFSARAGNPCVAEIASNPMTSGRHAPYPVCHWHAGVFTRLFRALVHRRAFATETACCAQGAPACRFEIGWD